MHDGSGLIKSTNPAVVPHPCGVIPLMLRTSIDPSSGGPGEAEGIVQHIAAHLIALPHLHTVRLIRPTTPISSTRLPSDTTFAVGSVPAEYSISAQGALYGNYSAWYP